MDEKLFKSAISGDSHEERLWVTTSGYLDSLVPSVADVAYRAAIVHWFNEDILTALAGANGLISEDGNSVSPSQLRDAYKQVQSLPFIEPYSDAGYNFHSLTRKVMLDHLWRERNEFYRNVSGLAATYFGHDLEEGGDVSTEYLVEYIYHGLITDEAVGLDVAGQLIGALSDLGALDVVHAMIESVQEQYDAKRVSDHAGWQIRIWRAELASSLGNYEDVVKMATATEAEADDVVPRWVQAAMASMAATSLTELGRFDEALHWLQRAQEYADPESPPEIAANLTRRGRLLRRWNRHAEAETALLDAIGIYVPSKLLPLRRTEPPASDQADEGPEATWTTVDEGETEGIVPTPKVQARHPEAWRRYDDKVYTVAVKTAQDENNELIELPTSWPLVIDAFLAQLWLELGFLYEDLDDYSRATASGQLSSMIALDAEDDSIATDAAQLLYRLGAKAQDSQRLGRTVIRQQERLLASARDRGDMRVQAQAQLNLGVAFVDTFEPEQARKHFTETLALARNFGDVGIQAAAYQQLAQLDWTQGSNTLAAERFERALHLLQESGLLDKQALLLTRIADFDLSRHRPEQAREHYLSALHLFRRLEIPAGEYSALRGLGSVAENRLRYAEASDFYLQALTAARKSSSPVLEADGLSALAQVEASRREFRFALQHYETAIARARLTGNRPMETELLEGVGYVDLMQQHAGRALKHFKESRRIAIELRRADRELAALLGILAAERALRYIRLAPKTAEEIISVSRHVADRDLEVRAWQDAGSAFSYAQQHERAVELLEQAVNADPDDPSLLGTLGWVLLGAGEYERALDVSEQAFARDPTVTFAVANQGLALLAQGRVTPALAAYQKAVDIRPESMDFADDIRILRRFLDDHPDAPGGTEALRLLESEQAKLSSSQAPKSL
jgi:tetratricopeptide (TPR) repeat protein